MNGRLMPNLYIQSKKPKNLKDIYSNDKWSMVMWLFLNKLFLFSLYNF